MGTSQTEKDVREKPAFFDTSIPCNSKVVGLPFLFLHLYGKFMQERSRRSYIKKICGIVYYIREGECACAMHPIVCDWWSDGHTRKQSSHKPSDQIRYFPLLPLPHIHTHKCTSNPLTKKKMATALNTGHVCWKSDNWLKTEPRLDWLKAFMLKTRGKEIRSVDERLDAVPP